MSIISNYDWPNWLRGLLAAGIGGGANAVVSAVGLNMTDPNHFNAQSPTFFKLVGTLFASSALVSFFMYLKQSPLPQVISKTVTTTIVEKTQTPTVEPTQNSRTE
jgi:Fe2+ transport system protein B